MKKKLPILKHLREIMKISAIQLFLVLLSLGIASAKNTEAQEVLNKAVSLKVEKTELKQILSQIESQTGVKFVYSTKIRPSKVFSLNINKSKLSEVLDEILSPVSIGYEVFGDRILLKKTAMAPIKKSSYLLDKPKYFDPQMMLKKVTGSVVDEQNQGIPGVSVVIKGTTKGITTDISGNFELDVPTDKTILVFSYVGFESKEVEVGNSTNIRVILLSDIKALSEVVVVGYGTQEKVNLTGAVGVASGKVLQNRPISTVGEGLQGVIPNLNITVRNGDPTAAVDFNIRGYESINGGSPLILVDGVPMDLNRINPNDIKSISVLKDAAAAAVYGARAAFGVVLVETKKGESGKIKVNFNNQISISKSIFNVDLVTDPYEFVTAQNKAAVRNSNVPKWDDDYVAGTKAYSENPLTAPQYAVVNGVIRFYGNNDYKNRLINDYSPSNQHDISVSGGSENAKLYASLGYINKDGFQRIGNDKFKRYNIMLKGDFKINKWLSLDEKIILNTQYSDKAHFYSNDVAINSVLRAEPFRLIEFPDLPYYINQGDRATYEPYIGRQMAGVNAIPYFRDGGRTTFTNHDLWLTQGMTLTPMKGLKIRTDFSYNIFNRIYQDVASKVEVVNPNLLAPDFILTSYSGDDYLASENTNNTYSVLNAYAQYEFQNLGSHSVTAMVGINQEEGKNRWIRGQNRGIISNGINDLSATTGTQLATGSRSHVALRGAFYRVNYDYKKRYLIELNGRYDGSSRFPSDSRYGFFPSFSGAWRISNEDFMESTSSWLTNLKIRASYGTLGNQLLGTNYYPYISTLSASMSQYIFNTAAAPIISPAGLVSPTLTWESVTSRNVGLDFTLFKGKLDATFDVYTRDTKDMLLDVSYPDILGTRAPKENGADLRTKGWEASMTWRDKFKKDWSYDVTLALSDAQAEITKYNNPSGDISTFYVGQKLGQIWGYETVGIFQSDDEVKAAPLQSSIGNNWRAGDMQYKDLNGDGKIDRGNGTLENLGDWKIIGNTSPRYTFGINTGIRYKSFGLSAFFQGIAKIQYLPNNTNYGWFYPFQSEYVEKFHITDSWSETNRDAYFGAPDLLGKKNIQPQSRYVQNASYIRLKNVNLSYTLPLSLVNRLKLENIQVYANGANVWEFSKIRKPLDPETIRSANVEYPMQRLLTFGLNVSF
jgi:TonB-linked SusC/RagA family outer membrane protein